MRSRVSLAVVLGALALWHFAAPPAATSAPAASVAQGRSLFQSGCASCHGLAGDGISGRGPDLRHAGAQAADFYLSTGRMPLSQPREPPARHRPAYGAADRADLVAFVGSLGGPGIPGVDPARGVLSTGLSAFTEHCAGCHQVIARGGIVTGAVAPPLQQATPTQIAEAVRVGPDLMPRFGPGEVDQHTLDSIARYVVQTRHPHDAGGWGIGHIGPIPEGMIAWLVALAALLIVARVIGEGVPR